MAKTEKVILSEAMVHTATALGIHVVREMAAAAIQKQPGLTMNSFITILDTHAARIKESQTVSVTMPTDPETPDTPDVIQL